MKVSVCIGAALGFLILATTANAQTKKALAAPKPAAASTGPSLDETLDFINKKLQSIPAGFRIHSDDFPPNGGITDYSANGGYSLTVTSTQAKLLIAGYGSTISQYPPGNPNNGHGFYEDESYKSTVSFNLSQLVPTVSIQNASMYPFSGPVFSQSAQDKIPLVVTIKLTCASANCFSNTESKEGDMSNSYPYPKDHKAPSNKQFNSSALLIPVNDPELAERLKKAFEHAIELSGGKREAF
jgi:hypothetical protein